MAKRKGTEFPGITSDPTKQFTPAFQSIPGQTPPITGGQTIRNIQPAVPLPTPPQVAVSALSNVPLNVNRINKFFVGRGEVTEQEFKRAKEEAVLTTELGGRRAVPTPEQLAQFEGQTAEGFVPTAEQEAARGQGLDIAGRLPEGAPLKAFSEGAATSIQENSKFLTQVFFAALDVFGQTARRTTGIGNKKPVTANSAERAFNDIASIIRSDIDGINNGFPLDPSATRLNIQLAKQSISSYEGFEKNLGFTDLRRYINEGIEIQTDILLMKNVLADLERDLAFAERNQMTKQFQAQPTFGFQ